MKKYKDKAGGSIVSRYEILEDGIQIEYNDGSVYLYNNEHNGKEQVDELKALAETGAGLSAYLQKHVRDNFAEKLR